MLEEKSRLDTLEIPVVTLECLPDGGDRCVWRRTFVHHGANQCTFWRPHRPEEGCGYNRCGGLGISDMSVDQYGRPWFSLSHNLQDIGIFATLTEGPVLRGSMGS